MSDIQPRKGYATLCHPGINGRQLSSGCVSVQADIGKQFPANYVGESTSGVFCLEPAAALLPVCTHKGRRFYVREKHIVHSRHFVPSKLRLATELAIQRSLGAANSFGNCSFADASRCDLTFQFGILDHSIHRIPPFKNFRIRNFCPHYKALSGICQHFFKLKNSFFGTFFLDKIPLLIIIETEVIT